jgi:hypothetical protein
MARNWTRPLLSLAMLAVLAGCEPAPVPNAAIAVSSDGTPIVVAVPCQGAAVTFVSVYDNSDTATHVAWTIHRPGGDANGVAEFPVFTTPAGWEVSQNDLTALAESAKYGVLASVGRRDKAYAEFTLADLKTLKAGQVWLDSRGGRAMDRAAFEKSADRSCH